VVLAGSSVSSGHGVRVRGGCRPRSGRRTRGWTCCRT
jgi:hypothetical protein